MQVSSAPAQVSALEIWLRETESAPGTPAPLSGSAGVAAAQPAAPALRDSAEGLLDLDVWHAVAASSARELSSSEPEPELVDVSTASVWAQHVFSALEPPTAAA